MKKDVLISIKSKWCEKIISGEKTVEVRKTTPRIDIPFRCFIYCTVGNPTLNIPISDERLKADVAVNGMQSMNCPIGNGKVIGEFVCDAIYKFSTRVYLGEEQLISDDEVVQKSCVPRSDLRKYEGVKEPYGLYGWHIADLKIYDEPKTILEMRFLDTVAMPERRVSWPPQSWRFVQEG